MPRETAAQAFSQRSPRLALLILLISPADVYKMQVEVSLQFTHFFYFFKIKNKKGLVKEM